MVHHRVRAHDSVAGDRETVFIHGREYRDTAKREKERKNEQRKANRTREGTGNRKRKRERGKRTDASADWHRDIFPNTTAP